MTTDMGSMRSLSMSTNFCWWPWSFSLLNVARWRWVSFAPPLTRRNRPPGQLEWNGHKTPPELSAEKHQESRGGEPGIAAVTSNRTNLSPFTKGCRDRTAPMRIMNNFLRGSAPTRRQDPYWHCRCCLRKSTQHAVFYQGVTYLAGAGRGSSSSLS